VYLGAQGEARYETIRTAVDFQEEDRTSSGEFSIWSDISIETTDYNQRKKQKIKMLTVSKQVGRSSAGVFAKNEERREKLTYGS